MSEADYYVFDQVKIDIEDFEAEGYILDIGGGGEGVIGRLKGRDVVAIDIRRDELEEAVDGPLKIVMDARDLKFLDESFAQATAFFSLMFINKKEDQKQIFSEIWRVLKPGGTLRLWEVDLAEQPDTEKAVYVIPIKYRVKGEEIGTGYGQRWPSEPRGMVYYREILEAVGFTVAKEETNQNTFFMLLEK